MLYRQFKRDKYKELVLYVVKSAGSTPNFGSILLNKILVDCDLTAYQEIGTPLTGQKIQHERMGPVSSALVPVAREMEDFEGSLESAWADFYGNPQRRYKAKREPNMALFNDEERKIIDDRIAFWVKLNGKEASEESHRRFGGWVFTEEREEIPYDSAFLSMRPLSQGDKDYALTLLASG